MKHSIYQVDDIDITLLKTNPPSLAIDANGMASTPNWSSVHLAKREYVTPPADGYQEFDLVGMPPCGRPSAHEAVQIGQILGQPAL